MSLSTYLQQSLQDHYLGVASFPQPTAWYTSAHTADPGETGANESADIARVQIAAFNAATSASPSVSNPDADVVYTNSGSTSVSVSHLGLWDASSGGNFFTGGTLSSVRDVPAGSDLRILASDFDVTLD